VRKDYISQSNFESIEEVEFVEDFWTQVWKNAGGPTGRFQRVFKQEEYRLMSKYFPKMPSAPSISLLDGGCGLGDWVLALASRGIECTGIDISKVTIKQLNSLFPSNKFLAGDIRHTNFPSNTFDGYYSWGVFEHFESGPKDCLKEAIRVLKPNGYLFITTPFDNLRHALLENSARGVHTPAERFYQYRFTRAELSRELQIAGFKVLATHAIHKRQGVLRFLEQAIGLPHKWRLSKIIAYAIAPFVPGYLFAHMVLAIAQKPES
jgi:ubiquinone/menaquinone biosynthesis C-methylase UbiE